MTDRETHKNMCYACCGPMFSHDKAGFRIRFGILLLLIGLIWYGSRIGWIDFAWLRTVHFWPLVVIMIGGWLIYRGLSTRRTTKPENGREV
jgi:hypothetical protein